jgi:hypothetical protein
MKINRQLAAIEPMVLHPLRELEGEEWHRAVAGKWSIAQIIKHLAIGIDGSGAALQKRAAKTGMKRRATPGQTLLRHIYLGVGRVRPGRSAPPGTIPEDRPDPETTLAQFRMGVARFETLAQTWPEQRQVEVFAKHPALGDLNLPEWVRFHFVHCRHHARQIRARLRWLAATNQKSGV